MSQIFYSGPGKVYISTQGFVRAIEADGVNGEIVATIEEKTTPRATATQGHLRETLDDQYAKITVPPFDNWSLIGFMLPAYLGVTTAVGTGGGTPMIAQTGLLNIGCRPHDWAGGAPVSTVMTPVVDAMAPVKVWARGGDLYHFVRGAVTKHPGMKFGVGVPLFSGCEITCLGDATKAMGASGFLMDSTSGGVSGVNDFGTAAVADPDSVGFTLADFINGKWTANWGSITGFDAMESEDNWELVPDIQYSTLTCQQLSRHMKLDSVNFMIKGRPVGPTSTQIAAKILAHTLGMTLQEGTAKDLVLTGPSSKTVTLKNCTIKGAGFEFGGTKLRHGEVGFVTSIVETAGAPGPSLIFT